MHPRAKAPDAVGGGGAQQLLEQHGAEATVLPAVLHHERDLDGVGRAGGLVARHRDDRVGIVGGLDHQRQPGAVVHRGEEARPVGRQAPHGREEAVVPRVEAEALVERHQPARVVGDDPAHSHERAVAQRHRPLEVGPDRPSAVCGLPL
jgi:hypothetical protein